MSTVVVVELPEEVGLTPQPASYGRLLLSSERGAVALQGFVEALEGTDGLGPGPRRAITESALGLDGSIANRARAFRRDEREIDLVVHVGGDGGLAPDVRARTARQLVSVLSPLRTTAGEPALVTLSGVMEDLTQVEIDGVAEFRGDTFGPQAAYDRVMIGSFTLRCPDPLWRLPERSAAQGQSGGGTFFPILPLVISDSTGLGDDLVLDVGGDALAYPTHVVDGPADTVRCENVETGDAWEVDLTASLIGGEQLVVRTDPRTVFTGTPRVQGPAGADLTGDLTARQLFALRPDRDVIRYTVTGASTSTRATVSWRPRLEGLL